MPCIYESRSSINTARLEMPSRNNIRLGGPAHNRFRQGKMDTFEVTMASFDEITQLRLVLVPREEAGLPSRLRSERGGGGTCRWFVDTLTLLEHARKKSNALWRVDVHEWLTNLDPSRAELYLPFDTRDLKIGHCRASMPLNTTTLDTLQAVRTPPPPCDPAEYTIEVHTISSPGWSEAMD